MGEQLRAEPIERTAGVRFAGLDPVNQVLQLAVVFRHPGDDIHCCSSSLP
jgi:hypothetical protein